MSTQADVRSIQALKDFRLALGKFSEEALAALGTVDTEVRRTIQWLQHDRKEYWANQIKRRREAVAAAKAEVFRRNLQKTGDNSVPMSEQKEILRLAEASLREAEAKVILVRKWEPMLQQAALEYRATTRRISNLSSADVERAMILLEKLVEALEAYLEISAPTAPVTERLAQVANEFEEAEASAQASNDNQAEADPGLPG